MTEHHIQAALEQIKSDDIHSVRVVFADQHGLLRGKTVAATTIETAFEHGVGVPGSLLHKDTGNTYAINLWKQSGDAMLDSLVGARNIIMRPDAATFQRLPWSEGTAIVLSDLETDDGQPIPHSTRGICARAVERLATQQLTFVAGLELEFHLYAVDDDGQLQHSHPGWDLLGEGALDRIEPALEPIRQGLVAMGLPPVTIEAELGPSQIEMTFAPTAGLDVADQAILARTTIRHIARRNGFQASFMSRPQIDHESFPSGWHLHQSLVASNDSTRSSLFAPTDSTMLMSDLGRQYVAGLLRHAAAACLLTTPTVTGYKRYRPRAITPDRVSWSREHRGAMLRVIGGQGDPATRVENRVGDPAANPYLMVASQILSGLDGIKNRLTPPPPTESPYEPEGGELLPRTLGEAIDHFDTSAMFRNTLGDTIVDYLVTLKRSEWNRFNTTVTDWEQREYFDLF